MKISDLSVDRVQSGDFCNELPEFYKLKNCIENNNGHNNDSVFNHSINALKEYEDFFFKNKNSEVGKYLNQKIDKHTRKELLFVSILFHDIAKPETFSLVDDISSCVGHEELGAKKVKNILKIFKLSGLEENIIINTIKHHNLLHGFAKKNINFCDKSLNDFCNKYFYIITELTILAISDIRGSQLKEINFEKFYTRDDYFNNFIKYMY